MSFQNNRYGIMLVGNSGVGKSSLIDKYRHKMMLPTEPTIGVTPPFVENFNVNDEKVELVIFDTSGHPRYSSVCRSYYRCPNGMIVVYDVTDRQSFDNVRTWITDINSFGIVSSNILLVGNKNDRVNDIKVSYEEGKSLAEELGCMFVECSATRNVDEVFNIMARNLYAKNPSFRYNVSPPVYSISKVF